jgi:DNA-binding transcriptional MerR regulator/effector-binding domain-containing protein
VFKVGAFARMSGTSVKTLHHYDEIGLVRPARVDPETGYRYYDVAQLAALDQIRTLKELGFSLEQIALLVSAELSTERLVELLRLKQVEVAERVRAEQERLARVTRHLRQLDADAGAFAFEVRAVPELRTAAVRRLVADTDADAIRETIRDGFVYLYGTLGRNRVTPAGPSILYWQETGGESEAGDVFMATPVAVELPPALTERGVEALTLPAVETMAVLTHHGPLSEIGGAYLHLFEKLRAENLRIVGGRRDVVLRYAGSTEGESVSELQFPVVRETAG